MNGSLGDLLRSFRSAARLSQEALAERSGLSTRTVSDIETGSAHSPRLITIMLLAEALGLSVADRTLLQNSVSRLNGRSSRAEAPGLPTQVPPLVGRDSDVARLCELLAPQRSRLVTLVGPVGVGKTALAIRVAAEMAGAFQGRVVFAELAPVRDPSLVAGAVAQTLGVRESGDVSAGDAVIDYLRRRTLLLVLDNLEHLAPAASWIGALLETCPLVTLIATSRVPLHLRFEQIYAVRPLDKDAAIVLFVNRAQMVRPDFEIDHANAPAVEALVEHLEGLPLAIELAAPQLQLLPPTALAARLERRLALLGNGALDRPERQQTMRNAIAWSYDLLSPEEQALFRCLSVLQGGGTLASAAAVGGDRAGEPSMLFRVAPLVEKNMLELVEDTSAQLRVSMLEMLREFAHERLAETGELDEVQQRHADYVLAFAESGARALSGAAQAQWLGKFELEHANIRAALQSALRSGQTALGLHLIAAVWRFWWLRGHLTEGVNWTRQFVRLQSHTPGEIADSIYGEVLRGQTVLLSALGNFDEALQACNEAIRLQRQAGNDAGLAGSLTSLGIILQYRSELDRAEASHNEGLEIRKRLGDEAGIANSLSNLSAVALSKNDLALAARLGEESAAIYRRLGHQSGLAHALMKIGLVAARRQNYAGAQELFGECLRIQQAVGDTNSMHASLANLGTVAHHRGDYALALERFGQALNLLEVTPNKAALAKTLEDTAATIAAVGDPARAVRLFSAAGVLRQAIGSPRFPVERAEYETALAATRSMLGDDAFKVQWCIGAGLGLERALDEARSASAEA